MFEGQIFDKLGNLLNGVLTNYNSKIPFNSDHPFPYLLEQFSNFFNRKFKTFFYHEKLIQIFPLENLIKFLKEMNVSRNDNC